MKAHHRRIWQRQIRECLNSLVSGIQIWWFLLIPLEQNFIRSRNRQIVCKKYFEYLLNKIQDFTQKSWCPLLEFHHYLYKPTNLTGRLLNIIMNCEHTCVSKFSPEVFRSHFHTSLEGLSVQAVRWNRVTRATITAEGMKM